MVYNNILVESCTLRLQTSHLLRFIRSMPLAQFHDRPGCLHEAQKLSRIFLWLVASKGLYHSRLRSDVHLCSQPFWLDIQIPIRTNCFAKKFQVILSAD